MHQAYYGVYHLACEALGLDPVNRYAEAKHRDVIDAVEKAPPGSARLHRMKRYMRKLKRLRAVADYDLASPLTDLQARNAVEMAESIITAPL